MKRLPPIYPFLFAVAPSLGLFADNIYEVYIEDLVRPLLVITILTLLAYWINRRLMIDSQRAALSTVILVAATFEFGPVWSGILAWNLGLRYAYFVTAWLVVSATIYLCCTLFLRLRKPNLTRLTAALNLVGLTVVVTPLLLAAYVTLSAPSLKGSVSEKQSRQREITV